MDLPQKDAYVIDYDAVYIGTNLSIVGKMSKKGRVF
jgi:hypothetical protein